MTNAYADLTTLKIVLAELATTDDARLRALAEAASRAMDAFCGRHFYSLIAARRFAATESLRLLLPYDVISVTSLKEDVDRNGSFEVTWAAGDYLLMPLDHAPTGVAGLFSTRPYWAIEVDGRTGNRVFAKGQARYEVTGKWGYSESTKGSGDTVGDNPLTAAATTLNVTSGGNFAIGQTLLVEAEQLYITNIVANALTVRRGVNGTTAASHVQATAISIIEYPPAIVQVATALTARRWMLERANYSFQLGSPDSGVVQIGGSLDLLDGEKRALAPFVNGLALVV